VKAVFGNLFEHLPIGFLALTPAGVNLAPNQQLPPLTARN